MASEGYYTAVVTARGVGLPLTTTKLWHPAMTDDAYSVLVQLRNENINILNKNKTLAENNILPVFLCAFSAGTNILRHLLKRLYEENKTISNSSDQLWELGRLREINNNEVSPKKYNLRSNNLVNNMKSQYRLFIAGSMSVCVAGEDYVLARTFLEHSSVESKLSNSNNNQYIYLLNNILSPSIQRWLTLGIKLLHNFEGIIYSMLMTSLYKVCRILKIVLLRVIYIYYGCCCRV
jgi:hypothetical protein